MAGPSPRVTVLGLNYPPEPTGVAPYTGAMARGLSLRGFGMRVVTAHPHYPDWRVRPGYGQWSRNEQIDGVDVRRVKHVVPSRPSGMRRLLSELSFGLRLVTSRWGGDALVAVSPALFSTWMASIRARIFHRRRPFVVWVQDLYTLGLVETGHDGGAVVRMMRAVEGRVLRRATRVIVIHERFATRIAHDFGVAPERIDVIRNWTHLAPAPDVDVAAARERFGWGDETVVLHAGNMGKKQNLEVVVEAARLAMSRNARVRFVLLGDGGERAHLERLGSGIASLEFIAPLDDDDFAKALGAADVLLVNEKPGVAEMAVPSKLTSYFSAGRPVLAATDASGITADEVRTADAGVVTPAGDAGALLDAALDLARDPENASRLGENGRHYRRTVLEETHAIEQFARLITELTCNPE